MGATIKGRLDTKKLDSLKKKLAAMQLDKRVQFGFFEEDKYGPDNDNLPVATVAWRNNTGTMTNPARPFFDNAVVDFKKEVRPKVTEYFRAILFDKKVDKHLKAIGDLGVDLVKQNIENYTGPNPTNSVSWAKWKQLRGAPNKVLMYTSRMLNSVKSRIVKGDS